MQPPKVKTPRPGRARGADNGVEKGIDNRHGAMPGTNRAWMRAHFLADQIGRYSPGPLKSQAIRDFLGAALFALRGGA